MDKKEIVIKENRLQIIPKYEEYMQYMIEIIFKIPRTEKFNIGTEYKNSMYKTIEDIMYLQKIEKSKKIYYLNKIDANLNTQRILLRIMYKNKWIDAKKFNIVIDKIYVIGNLLGGLIKYYAKNNKK